MAACALLPNLCRHIRPRSVVTLPLPSRIPPSLLSSHAPSATTLLKLSSTPPGLSFPHCVPAGSRHICLVCLLTRHKAGVIVRMFNGWYDADPDPSRQGPALASPQTTAGCWHSMQCRPFTRLPLSIPRSLARRPPLMDLHMPKGCLTSSLSLGIFRINSHQEKSNEGPSLLL